MKTQDRKNRGSAGFTVAELIAVAAVICCLVLVALPAFAKSEGRGLSVACRNNQRLMMAAFHMYADENNSFFAGNEGFNSSWITIYEPSPATNQLSPRNFAFAPYVPARQNVLKCPADSTVVRRVAGDLPRVRSISMSQAVGTKGSTGAQKAPVDGIWLDGSAGHIANSRFYCYGKTSDMIDPTPERLWVFIEEHPDSINDGGFANVGPIPPNQYRMIDLPGAWHDGAAMLGFADGHVEEKRWVDSRTVPIQPVFGASSPANNPDITWLANRTTAPVPR